MIVVQAQMWPNGNQLQGYEVLHATISNTSSPGAESDSYIANVMARPNIDKGIIGYEADVEVTSHKYNHGFVPLLMSVLIGAHADDEDESVFIPPCKTLSRLVLREMRDFEARVRGK